MVENPNGPGRPPAAGMLGHVPSLRRPARLDRFSRSQVFQSGGTRHGADVTTYALERPGAVLRGRIVHGDQPDALLYFGGNAEHITRWGDRFREHVPHRATYLVGYRGYGASTGEPSERAIVADSMAVYDDLCTRHERVAVLGRSLGSGVAVQIAAARDIDRLVLVTPFDSLVAVIRDLLPIPLPGFVRKRLPIQWLLAERFDSVGHSDRVTAPTLVLRSGRDEVVLPARTDRLLAHLPATTEVVEFAEDDHGSLAERDDYWQAISEFLR